MSGLIHVGAWDGSEYVAEAVHRPRDLLLFEPQADAFKRLEANLGRFDRVKLIRLALGAKMGMATLHVSIPDHSSSVLAPKEQLDLYPEITFNGTETVKMATLDSVMARRRLQGRYNEMVIDVQGYELEVLKGAKRTLRDIRWIKCEVTWAELYEGCAQIDQVDAFLKRFGLARYDLDTHSRGSYGDALYAK